METMIKTNHWSFVTLAFLSLTLSSMLSACGGSGSSSGSSNNGSQNLPLRSLDNVFDEYTGSIEEAELSPASIGSYISLYSAFWGFADSFITSNDVASAKRNANRQTGQLQETAACADSGSRELANGFGIQSDTVWVRYKFEHCHQNGFYLNGTYEYLFPTGDRAQNSTANWFQLKLYDLQLEPDDSGLAITGVIKATETRSTELQYVMDLLINRGTQSAFLDNYVGYFPSVPNQDNTQPLTARLFDSTYGQVNFSTSQPLQFSEPLGSWPSAGGPFVMEGANLQRASVEIIESPDRLWLELYTDDQLLGGVATHWDGLANADNTASSDNSPLALLTNNTNFHFIGNDLKLAEQIPLDGRFSTDPDLDLLNFEWILEMTPEGSNASLENNNAAVAFLNPDRLGAYQLAMRVTDSQLNSSTHRFIVILSGADVDLNWEQRQPIAEINSPLLQDIRVTDKPIELDLTASQLTDFNGNPLDFITLDSTISIVESPEGSTPQITSSGPLSANFTADLAGTYLIQIDIQDGERSHSTRAEITVEDINEVFIPNVHLPSDPLLQFATVGETYQQEILAQPSSYGLNNNQFEWQLTSAPANSQALPINPNSEFIAFTPDVPGKYQVSFRARNSLAQSDWQVVDIYASPQASFQRELLFNFDTQHFETFSFATSLIVQDLTGDGFIDTYIGSESTGIILAGAADSTLNQTRLLFVGNGPIHWIMDLYGDEEMKLIKNLGQSFYIYQIGDTQVIQRQEIIQVGANNHDFSQSVAFADYDNDGDTDFLVERNPIDNTPGGLTVFEQLGPEVWNPLVIANLNKNFWWWKSQWLDLNSDGLQDALALGWKSNYGDIDGELIYPLAYATQKADGGFDDIHYVGLNRQLGMPSIFAEFNDLNQDGNVELIAYMDYDNQNKLGVWTLSAGKLVPVQQWLPHSLYNGSHPQALWAADINLDSRTDLVFVTDTEIYIFYQTGDLRFEQGEAISFQSDPDWFQFGYGDLSFVKLVDYDADGDKDLVLLEAEGSYENPGRLVLYRNLTR